jgi:hypothetical protein
MERTGEKHMFNPTEFAAGGFKVEWVDGVMG